jgi:thiamine biosynthesis lipoprotein
MATVFEIHCAHDDLGYARQAAQAAFQVVDALEQGLSRFLANSDVARINDLRAGESTRVTPSTLECLQIARRLYETTGGAFDVSIGTGLRHLELRADDFTVRAQADGIRLDLGGIGKGYAVDRMAETLEEWEIRRALVHGGFSSVRALAPPPDREGWVLTLSAPGPGVSPVRARISASHMVLSASGTGKGEHIVDPRTGGVARWRAAWATLTLAGGAGGGAGPSGELDSGESPAAVAEGLSTAFMLLPSADIEGICRGCPGLEAWLAPKPADGVGPAPDLVHLPLAPPDVG